LLVNLFFKALTCMHH